MSDVLSASVINGNSSSNFTRTTREHKLSSVSATFSPREWSASSAVSLLHIGKTTIGGTASGGRR